MTEDLTLNQAVLKYVLGFKLVPGPISNDKNITQKDKWMNDQSDKAYAFGSEPNFEGDMEEVKLIEKHFHDLGQIDELRNTVQVNFLKPIMGEHRPIRSSYDKATPKQISLAALLIKGQDISRWDHGSP